MQEVGGTVSELLELVEVAERAAEVALNEAARQGGFGVLGELNGARNRLETARRILASREGE
jgi:hypothetical protein